MKKRMLPLNLQFFAEKEENPNDVEEKEKNDDVEEKDLDDEKDVEDEKKFTQKDLNKLLAREKRDGRKSVLKSLGFETEEEAKSAFNLLKALTDSQKSDEQKLKEENKNVTKTLDSETKRANDAESKLSCLLNGVNKDSIDDVLAIANNKIDDENSLEDVLKEMKKNKRYSSFFEDGSKSSGTGNPPGHGGKKTEKGNYGMDIAKSNKPREVKNSFFD